MANNTVNPYNSPNTIIITDSDQNQITVTQPVTSLIEVGSVGPQGAKGDKGDTGESGSLQPSNSGSFEITGSLLISGSGTLTNIGPAIFSGSLDVTQGITGSFSGSGADLYDIPASGIVGLNLSQIATGSITASVSPGVHAFNITSGSNEYLSISGSTGVTQIGSLKIGYRYSWGNEFALVKSNFPLTPTSYAVAQNNSGDLLLNAISGRAIYLGVGGSQQHIIKSTGFGINTNQLSATLTVNGTGRFLSNVRIDEDLTVTGSLLADNITGSLFGTSSYATTASYAEYAVSASYEIIKEVSASHADFADSASYALTASYLDNYIPPFPYTGSAEITGSLGVTGSVGILGETTLYKSGSTVLDVQGSQGQLFSVVDELSGSLMSVNDISGLPILEVFSDDRVEMGTYGSPGLIVSGSSVSTNDLTISGALSLTGTGNATQETAVIQSLSGSIAIVPSGSGAITAQVPDGTTAGGNARGNRAVDFQRVRSSADQVAGGSYSTIINGFNNKNNEYLSTIVGGSNNTVSNQGVFIGGGANNSVSSIQGVVVGGQENSATTGGYGFVGGGLQNRSQQQYCVVSGGQSNTASTNTHSTVVGGYQNSSTGQYSVSGGFSNVASGQGAVALGYDNTASGTYNVALGRASNSTGTQKAVCIGFSNTSSGAGSSTFGGELNQATASYSVSVGGSRNLSGSDHTFTSGTRAMAYLQYQKAHGGGYFGGVTLGLQQFSELIRAVEDTITSGATTIVATNILVPTGTNRVWNVTVETVAVVTSITGTATGVSVGDSLLQNDIILFSKIGGTSSVVGTNNTQFISSTSLSTASMGYSAGASQELALTFTAPTFTGGGSVTMRVVSKVSLVEVAY